jgi:predicted RNA-binding Zn-ribbon protein involved in translation (DUF1610 family)
MQRTVIVAASTGTVELTRPERYIEFPCPKCGTSHLIRTIPGARCIRCGAVVVSVKDGAT